MSVFAGTFTLIAWLNPDDNAHARVAAYLDGFTGRLVTTEWVLMEVADALSRGIIGVIFFKEKKMTPITHSPMPSLTRPIWPPSWPPGPSSLRRSAPASWRWSRPPRESLTGFLRYTATTYCSAAIYRFTCAAWHQDLALGWWDLA